WSFSNVPIGQRPHLQELGRHPDSSMGNVAVDVVVSVPLLPLIDGVALSLTVHLHYRRHLGQSTFTLTYAPLTYRRDHSWNLWITLTNPDIHT
ncbi:hypothetical protein M513_13023, partial [Trichuris suis]